MQKLSPLFKKPAVLGQENISVEEFMDSIPPEYSDDGGVIVDNTITEILPQPDISIDPMIESEVVADQLETLAGDVDAITTAPAFESYKRIYQSYSNLAGYPLSVNLESFAQTRGGRRALAKNIREHATMIRDCIGLGFEAYADKVDESVGTMVSNYKQTLGKLNSIRNNLLDKPDKFVLVNQKEGWQLFHLANELIDMTEFRRELAGITELEKLISSGIDNAKKLIDGKGKEPLLSKFLNILLLDNTTVKVKDGRATFDKVPAPKPNREMTSSDWYKHLAYAIINKDYKDGDGEELTAVLESTKVFAKVIEETKKLGPVVDKIDRDVDELIKLVRKVPDGERGEIEKAVSPVLELAANTIRHVTEVTHGLLKMLGRMGN